MGVKSGLVTWGGLIKRPLIYTSGLLLEDFCCFYFLLLSRCLDAKED